MTTDIPTMTDDQYQRATKEIERSTSECPENLRDGRNHHTYFVARLDGKTNYHWCATCGKGYEARRAT